MIVAILPQLVGLLSGAVPIAKGKAHGAIKSAAEALKQGHLVCIFPEGKLSTDGKVDTYARCVEALCGPADTFFTSVFSAQGKRPLSAFKNAEIKTLLADLLGLEQVRQQGALAADVEAFASAFPMPGL